MPNIWALGLGVEILARIGPGLRLTPSLGLRLGLTPTLDDLGLRLGPILDQPWADFWTRLGLRHRESVVETEQMSSVETGQMTAAETSVLSQQKTVKNH